MLEGLAEASAQSSANSMRSYNEYNNYNQLSQDYALSHAKTMDQYHAMMEQSRKNYHPYR